MQAKLSDMLICDDVRREEDGRLSLMGLYPGATVTVHQLPTILSQFALVLRFTGIEDEVELQSRIRAPDGHEAYPAPGRKMGPQTSAGEAVYVLQAAPVQISVPGWHQVHLKIDDQVLETGFRVERPE